MSAKKMLLSLCAALAFVSFLPWPEAMAREADRGSAVKSLTPAHSIYIDKSMYADADSYYNPSVKEHVVKVGLSYGTEAVSRAVFENSAGQGFALGYFDGRRSFVPLVNTQESVIIVEYADTAAYGQAEADGCFQVLSGLDSSLIYSSDASFLTLGVYPAGDAYTAYTGEYYSGAFECILNADGLITVVNYVPLEDYVKGVIPYEMSAWWPFEALCAQAVCARTYAVYNIDAYAYTGFDVTDDTYSQVYRGRIYADSITDSAVDTTAGLLVRYQGQVCEIYYFSSDGGATEEGINVFDSDMPYLAGKPDPFENAVDYTLRSWSFEKTAEELSALLCSHGYEIDTVDLVVPQLSGTGNVIGLSYYDERGQSVHIDGRRCYTMLGLHNCNFTVEKKENRFIFAGSGWGHNCGMSQWGAFAMADVYGYNYEDIIRFYFTGVYVA